MATIDDWFDETTLMELVPIDVYVRGASAVEAGAVRIIKRDGAQLLTSGRGRRGRRRCGVEPRWRAAHVSRAPAATPASDRASTSSPRRWPRGPVRRRDEDE